MATLSVSAPSHAGQRPVRLAAVPSRRLVFRLTGAAPLQCVRIAASIRPRSPQAERLALPLQASKAFALLQGDIRGIQALVPNNQIARGKRTLFLSVFNNFTARAKIALFASAPSSELSAALSHRRKAAMLACALRSSSSQKSHSVAIFGNPVRAHYTAWAVLRKRVNFARFIKSNSAFQNRILNKRTLVGAVGCALALSQSGNARMHAPLLLFPKISLRCDFREPF